MKKLLSTLGATLVICSGVQAHSSKHFVNQEYTQYACPHTDSIAFVPIYIPVQKATKHKHKLHKAAARNNIHELYYLISQGTDSNIQDGERNTPLHEAAAFNSQEAVRALIYSGADICARDIHGDTPLHKAVYYSSIKSAQELIKSLGYCELNLRNKAGLTPLDVARRMGNTKLVRLLHTCN